MEIVSKSSVKEAYFFRCLAIFGVESCEMFA